MIGYFSKRTVFLASAYLIFSGGPAFSQCSSPAGVAGEMGYDLTSTGQMEYCDGTSWIGIGSSLASTTTDSGSIDANIVFVTSTTHDGNLGGISGADTICQTRADAESLGGTFKAWISTSFSDDPQNTFTQSAVPYQLVDGTTVADDWADLIDGTLSNAINLDETGASVSDFVWTFVGTDGQSGGSDNCGAWTVDNGGADGDYGSSSSTSSTWTASSTDLCSETYRLYCFQQDGGDGGPVGHWKLDEVNGTSIADSSGNGNTGTFSGETEVVSAVGKIDTALTFDGSDDEIDLGSPSEINSLTGALTVSAWIYPESYGSGGSTNARVISRLQSTSEAGFEINIESSSDKLLFRVPDTASTWIEAYDGYEPPLNAWTHVVGVFEPGVAVRLYVNGIENASTATAVTTQYIDTSTSITIGARPDACSNCYFDGNIDDVRIYGSALSEDEVLNLYQQTKNYGIVGHWKLDETSGTSVTDYSANGYDGTFSGETNVVSVTGKTGSALEFDGSDDRITVSSFNVAGDGITLGAWIYPESYPDDPRIISKSSDADSASTHAWALFVDDPGTGYLVWRLQNSGGTSNITSNYAPSLNKWTHVLTTYDASTAEVIFYINGEAVRTTSHPSGAGAVFTSSWDVGIGNQPAGADDRQWDGYLDDVRVYDRVLSPSEAARLSICTKPGEVGYNFADHVLQWCDEVLDVYNVGAPGSGGAGCSASGALAAGDEGAMQYDTTNNVMVFCDGANWVDMPN